MCTRIWCVHPLDLEVGARVTGDVGVDRVQRAIAAVATDRRVNRARSRLRTTVDERPVLTPKLVRGQRSRQGAVHLVRTRHDDQARGVTVEAVHDPGA
jgi:hypothetical protein